MWLLYLFAICVLITLGGDHRTVTTAYADAAMRWFHGENLYNGAGTNFIYFPQSAILYYPFTWFSTPIGNILWRTFSIGIYALGIYRFAELTSNIKKRGFFPLITILSLPIAFLSARNGQMNLILAGFSLLALIDIKDGRFWRATAILCVSFAFKPTTAVILLLCFALFPALRWRLLIGIVVTAAFPFLTQSPQYVISQYHDVINMLQTSANLGTDLNIWAQLFGLLAMAHVHVSSAEQYVIRAIAAIATLGLCWYAWKRRSPESAFFYLYAFSAVYLMLFNPRTENNDYAILAPAIGFAFAYYYHHQQKFMSGLMLFIVAAIAGGFTIGHSLTPGHVSWVTPLMASLFLLVLTYEAIIARPHHSVNQNHPSLVRFTITSGSSPRAASRAICRRMTCGSTVSKQMLAARRASPTRKA